MRTFGSASPLSPLLQLLLVAGVVTAAPAVAQATHLVGPGGFPQITDAIAAAQPGDLILVQQGTYLPFDVPIGVRIVAPNGASVTPTAGANFTRQVTPPAGQQATIAGLIFRTVSFYPPAIWPVKLNITGHVVFTDCYFTSNNADYPGSPTVCNGDVQFDRCVWLGLDDCLQISGGRVQLNECSLTGIWTSYNPPPARAILITGGELAVFSSDLRGSSGAPSGSCPGSAGIELLGSARLRLVDSTVLGGDGWPGCPGASGVANSTGFAVLHARSQVVGGTGAFSVQEPPFTGLEVAAPLVGGFGPIDGPGVGGPYTGTVIGPVTGIAAVGLTFAREPAVQLPFLAQSVHFNPADVIAYQWGVTSAPLPGWPGFGTFTIQTASLSQAMQGLEFWLHPLVWDGGALQVGPTLGGVVR